MPFSLPRQPTPYSMRQYPPSPHAGPQLFFSLHEEQSCAYYKYTHEARQAHAAAAAGGCSDVCPEPVLTNAFGFFRKHKWRQ